MSNGHWWVKVPVGYWLDDHKLRLCDPAARGIWLDLLCLMQRTGGYLSAFRVESELRQIARILRTSERQIARCLEILKHNGVASVTDDGVIYCQWMVNDFKASEAGRAGAEQRWGRPNPNGSPNGGANGQANGNPITQESRVKSQEVPPLYPPLAGAKGGLTVDVIQVDEGRHNRKQRRGARPGNAAAAAILEGGFESDPAQFRAFVAARRLRHGGA